MVDDLLVFVSWGWQGVGRNENRHFWIWEVSSISSSFNILTNPSNETVHYFVLGQGPHPFSPGAHTDIRVFQCYITESVGDLVDCRRCLNIVALLALSEYCCLTFSVIRTRYLALKHCVFWRGFIRCKISSRDISFHLSRNSLRAFRWQQLCVYLKIY